MTSQSPSPPALDTLAIDLSLAIGQLLRRLRTESNPEGLSWSQTLALADLQRAGPMTTADLARAASVKPQSMGATLAELERDALVERRPHPTDGRQVLFALTESGIGARRKRSAAKQTWLIAALEQLTADERRTLVAATSLIKRLGTGEMTSGRR